VQLAPGARGEAVRELQDRLGALGFPVVVTGEYDDETESAVRRFQSSRGLRETGHCERETWTALLEAGFALGDRLLYHRRPMLRGDDVLDLQHRLNALGFHAGREDGIFGPRTEAAVREFQRNAGIAADGVLGPATRAGLVRLGALADGSVAQVRERERLREGRVAGSRIFVAAEPGLDVLAGTVAHQLATYGALAVVDRTGSSEHDLADAANEWAADAVVALRFADAPGPRCYFFAHKGFRSEGGYALAVALHGELVPVLGPAPAPAGRTFALLRETRMPAVVCEPAIRGDAATMADVVGRAPDVAGAIVAGVRGALEGDLAPGKDG
jgi:N-acetylmuramoyl-L-alanine amidase